MLAFGWLNYAALCLRVQMEPSLLELQQQEALQVVQLMQACAAFVGPGTHSVLMQQLQAIQSKHPGERGWSISGGVPIQQAAPHSPARTAPHSPASTAPHSPTCTAPHSTACSPAKHTESLHTQPLPAFKPQQQLEGVAARSHSHSQHRAQQHDPKTAPHHDSGVHNHEQVHQQSPPPLQPTAAELKAQRLQEAQDAYRPVLASMAQLLGRAHPSFTPSQVCLGVSMFPACDSV